MEDKGALGATAPGTGATTGGATGGGVTGSAVGSAANPLRDPNNILSKRSIYFDFDSFVVKDEYRPLVEAHARYLQQNRNWLAEVARNGKGPRTPLFMINNILGLMKACQRGLGIALLPDYLVEDAGLVQLFGEGDSIALDCYFVYPEELKSVARVQVFRDFLVANAQRWNY